MDQRPFIPQPVLIPVLAALVLIPVALYLLGFIGGGKAGPSASPASSLVAEVSPSPSPSEVPSAPPSAPPSEAPSASTPPSEAPSATLPTGVDQWAADARQSLFARNPSFDTGNFVGPSGLSANTAYQFQRYDNALLYKPVSSDQFLVLRSPILDKFISLTPVVANPDIGVPQGNRRNDNNNRFAQRFANGGIACSDIGCFDLPRELYDTWFGQPDAGPRLQVGYPIEAYTTVAGPPDRLYLHTETGWVVYDTGTTDWAVCDANKQALGGTTTDLCSF